MDTHYINSEHLSLSMLETIISQQYNLKLSKEAIFKITNCREYLQQKLNQDQTPVYGINTGFGSLCDVKISSNKIQLLQRNLVMSHACGLGDEVPEDVSRIILFLKIQSLSYGHSGVTLKTINKLLDLYNKNMIPVMYQQGSLGASGDLAPLAHLSLPLLGEGEVWYEHKKTPFNQLKHFFEWESFELESKEGLALLNGTQFSCGYGVWAIFEAFKISKQADTIASLSLDAFDCRLNPFDDRLHQIRPHLGQIKTAQNVREILTDSQISKQVKTAVQDPYAFRCIPQVHGASKDTIDFVAQKLSIEINSVTDNPNIFPNSDAILSGGNFHAQPLALPLDFLAIAIAELGNISERRTYQLIAGLRNLPPFLVKNPGLNSGFMIPQYTAASIVSQNKQLCTPASVDSIVSSNGQEDHVSMAANAATKLYRVIQNTQRILAIEWMNAAQAIEFRRPLKTAPYLENLLKQYRSTVASLENDRILYKDIQQSCQFLKEKLS